jgi:RimJ/RimL family protein N-acetyltransferase
MVLSVADKFVKLCPIRESDISLINQWYHRVESFRYATGGKRPEEILIKMKQPSTFSAFISGIYHTGDNTCIGLIAGEFKTVSEPLLWIKTIFVDTCWQRKHYGTMALRLLLRYSREVYRIERAYVSVHKKNTAGTAFWKNSGFVCVKVLKAAGADDSDDVLIMEKVIGL